jgi:hypothetical protein
MCVLQKPGGVADPLAPDRIRVNALLVPSTATLKLVATPAPESKVEAVTQPTSAAAKRMEELAKPKSPAPALVQSGTTASSLEATGEMREGGTLSTEGRPGMQTSLARKPGGRPFSPDPLSYMAATSSSAASARASPSSPHPSHHVIAWGTSQDAGQDPGGSTGPSGGGMLSSGSKTSAVVFIPRTASAESLPKAGKLETLPRTQSLNQMPALNPIAMTARSLGVTGPPTAFKRLDDLDAKDGIIRVESAEDLELLTRGSDLSFSSFSVDSEGDWASSASTRATYARPTVRESEGEAGSRPPDDQQGAKATVGAPGVLRPMSAGIIRPGFRAVPLNAEGAGGRPTTPLARGLDATGSLRWVTRLKVSLSRKDL